MTQEFFEQGTPEWHRQRLGIFTGSEVGKLMGKGRSKDAIFSVTGLSYIKKKAGERHLKDLSDEKLMEYIQYVNRQSMMMAYGSEMEAVAAAAYSEQTGAEVIETTLHLADNLSHFGSSPDRLIVNNGQIVGCLEIKNIITPERWYEYYAAKTAEDIKAINAEYYWQCYAHMICVGVNTCDFIVYNEFADQKLLKFTFDYDPNESTELITKVIAADNMIEEWEQA